MSIIIVLIEIFTLGFTLIIGIIIGIIIGSIIEPRNKEKFFCMFDEAGILMKKKDDERKAIIKGIFIGKAIKSRRQRIDNEK